MHTSPHDLWMCKEAGKWIYKAEIREKIGREKGTERREGEYGGTAYREMRGGKAWGNE
jgi:hypothetical protein